jgi:phenylacetate-CoA ligase
VAIPSIEYGSKEEIKTLQEQKLNELLTYVAAHSPFYRDLFEKHGIHPNSIKTLDDLRRIPPTTKEDIAARNDDFRCVPQQKIIDYVTTSGTLGDPVIFVLTENDLERLAYNEAISFACTGSDENELFQLTTTIDRRFMAGLAYFLGARKLGAGIVRVGSGIPELQWDTILKIKPTALIAVPSFLLKLVEYAQQQGIDYKNSSPRKAICIGEPIRNTDFSLNTLGKRIQELWPLELYSTYASTEMGAAFTECSHAQGGHAHPELVILEFLDDHDQPVSEQEPGEVVVTTLGVEGMPLIRFKTGDICYHYTDACACGRTTTRLGPIIGRRKQMIKYKGTTLYPPAFFDLLNDFDNVLNYAVEVFTNELGTDEILIRIACQRDIEGFEKTIRDHFRAKLRVSPTILFQSQADIAKIVLPEISRKPIKFFDKRTNNG